MMFVVPFLLEEILHINQDQNKSTLSCETQRGKWFIARKDDAGCRSLSIKSKYIFFSLWRLPVLMIISETWQRWWWTPLTLIHLGGWGPPGSGGHRALEGGQFRFWLNLKVPFMYTCGINHFFRIFNPTFDEWKSRFGVQSSHKRDLKNRKKLSSTPPILKHGAPPQKKQNVKVHN